MTRYLVDVASYQGSLTVADCVRAGFTIINLKIGHGLTQRSVHPDLARWVLTARQAGCALGSFHFLTGDADGITQAHYAYGQLERSGLLGGTGHVVDVESNPVGPDATEQIVREYVATMQSLLGRPIMIYTGDWWWQPKGWNVADLTPYLHAAPNAGYLGSYPGDTSGHWTAGYGGWPELAAMQYAVGPLAFPDGTAGTIDVSKSALRDDAVWTALTEGPIMAMDPRTHPRGAPPNFSMTGLPANPNPSRMTDALWWLVQMRLRLEPGTKNGGTLAIKPGYHSYGSRLPDHGAGASATDHSIRRPPDRTGPWWRDYTSAHDWTFPDAQSGRYATIAKYCVRLRNSMRDPDDLRPDNVYAYFIGQIDSDTVVEGYNEYTDSDQSGDSSHLWHRHDSFRRNIIGDFGAMWKALTIDMGWTYAEWKRSTERSAEKEDDMAEGLELDKAPVGYPAKNPSNPTWTGWNALGSARDYAQEARDHARAARADAGAARAGVAALTASVGALATSFAQASAENAAREAATAALIQQLLDMVTSGGGSVDVAAVLAKLDEVRAEIVEAADAAGNAASFAVMDHMRRAAQAEVDVLQGAAEGLDAAIRANPPQS